NMSFAGTLRVSKVGSYIRGSFYSDPKQKYTCPELRVLFALDSIVEEKDELNSGLANKLWQPSIDDNIVIDDKDGPQIKSADPTIAATERSLPELNYKKLVDRFKKRQNVVINELTVKSDSIRVSFFDNGDIDGDSISVFLNGAPILEKRE